MCRGKMWDGGLRPTTSSLELPSRKCSTARVVDFFRWARFVGLPFFRAGNGVFDELVDEETFGAAGFLQFDDGGLDPRNVVLNRGAWIARQWYLV